METLIAFLVGAFIGVLITSLTVFAAFKMAEKEIEQREESEWQKIFPSWWWQVLVIIKVD